MDTAMDTLFYSIVVFWKGMWSVGEILSHLYEVESHSCCLVSFYFSKKIEPGSLPDKRSGLNHYLFKQFSFSFFVSGGSSSLEHRHIYNIKLYIHNLYDNLLFYFIDRIDNNYQFNNFPFSHEYFHFSIANI